LRLHHLPAIIALSSPSGRSLDALAAIGSYVVARAQRAARLGEESQ
jgi:hypothetical protein